MEPWIYDEQVRPTFDAVAGGTLDDRGRHRPGYLSNLDHAREVAKNSPYPINRLLNVLADLAELDREAFLAAQRAGTADNRGDDPRRVELVARHHRERRHAATAFHAMLQLMMEHYPDELLASMRKFVDEHFAEFGMMFAPFLAKLFSPTWDHVNDRLDALETAAAEQLEPAL